MTDRPTNQPTNRPNDATDGQNYWSEESFTSNNRALISCMHAYAVSHYLVQKNKGYKKICKNNERKKMSRHTTPSYLHLINPGHAWTRNLSCAQQCIEKEEVKLG